MTISPPHPERVWPAHPLPWGWATAWLGEQRVAHVVPTWDLSPHTFDMECRCRPAIDDENDAQINHNAFDGREAIESGVAGRTRGNVC